MRPAVFRALGFAIAVFAIVLVFEFHARAQQDPAFDPYPNCEGFIAVECCCTANACFDIPRSAIERLTEDTYRIIRTGEVVKAKGRSPHGRVRRCTGNRDETGWHLIGHPDAKTNCLYVTDTGS